MRSRFLALVAFSAAYRCPAPIKSGPGFRRKMLQCSRRASFESLRGKTARFAALLATLVITSVTVNALIIAASQAR